MPPNFNLDGVLLASSSSNAKLQEDPSHDSDEESLWVCPASAKSVRTTNPIRAIVDPIVAHSIKSGTDRGDGKDQISLALGDPTVYGNLPPCPVAVSAITRALQRPAVAAGYVNACGTPEARAAIAKYHSVPGVDIVPDDVIVANGCSGALELALTTLLDEGSVLLVPKPGFPLYQVIAESHGASVEHYDLMPDRGWECDLEHMERLILEGREGKEDKVGNVRAIVVNNPSNPTGSVYSEEHLADICHLARRHRIPIVADEIYGDMTFGDATFHPLANVAAKLGRHVPVIAASGLGKQYLVPGWRIGWIVFHDSRHRALREVQAGAKRLAQVVLGASHLVQHTIPAVLTPSFPEDGILIAEWKAKLNFILAKQAAFTYESLSRCNGLSVIAPQGAMYVMVRIESTKFDASVQDDMSFTKMLLEEENVFVLPGRAFGASSDQCHVFRVVFCAPEMVLAEAFDRIADFCRRHTAPVPSKG